MDEITSYDHQSDYLSQAKQALLQNDIVNFLKAIGAAEVTQSHDSTISEDILSLQCEGLYQFYHYEAALAIVDKALNILDNPEKQALFFRRKGILLGKLGQFDEASQIFEELLKNPKYTIWSLNNLAWINIYKYQLEPERKSFLHKAFDFCQQAIGLIDSSDDHQLLKSVFTNVGNVYWHLGDYSKALQSFENSLTYDKDDPKILNNIAATYAKMHDNEKAEQYLHDAEMLAENNDNFFEIGQTHLIHAEIQEQNYNDYMNAKDHFMIAFDNFVQANTAFEACMCFDNILRLGEKLNRETIAILSQRLKENVIHQFGQERLIQFIRR